jgi:hypothetical protein
MVAVVAEMAADLAVPNLAPVQLAVVARAEIASDACVPGP